MSGEKSPASGLKVKKMKLRELIRSAGCRDTSVPEAYFRHETPDLWLRELQEKIAADIRREEARAREQMAWLCSLPAAKDA